MRQGRQPGDVRAQHPAQLGGLGLAERGELACGVDDRAVVLAQLDGNARQRLHLRGVANGREGRRKGIGISSALGTGNPGAGNPGAGECLAQPPCPSSREILDGIGPEGRVEVAQYFDGEVVIGLVARSTAVGGERIDLAGATPAALGRRPVGRLVVRTRQARGHQSLQGPAHSGGCQVQARGDLAGSRRAVLSQRPRDALGCVTREFHNTHVT